MTYVRVNWQDLPSNATPVDAANLNNMDIGIAAAYVQGTGTLVNADIAAGAAIAKSKLAALDVLNSDIDAAAAIAISKLADPGASTVIGSLGAGTVAIPFSSLSGGAPLSVLSAAPVLEPGISGQVRAGRVLALTDFTTLLGLTAPVGLYNLGTTADISGNARTLTNKGAVTFGPGITAAATEAAIFTGSTAQALYSSDAGFRIPYGSWGCWFKTAKSGVEQTMIGLWDGGAGQSAYLLEVSASNVANGSFTNDGSTGHGLSGVTVVTDNRWHLAVVTYDGTTLSLYVDSKLENSAASGSGPIFAGTKALNIGGQRADGSTAATFPFFGPIDEAFVTQDVLTLDQIRLLYTAKIAHTLGLTPGRVQLNVRRRKRGGALVSGNFSTAPLHLYNFTAGALTDAGSLANTLTNNATAVVAPGADGTQGNCFNFVSASSQYLSATDAGLPAGTTARTLGCWFKTTQSAGTCNFINYGTTFATNDVYLDITSAGLVRIGSGNATVLGSVAAYNDGQWHFAVAVLDPAAVDGLLQKLYVDGKLVASATTALVSTTLGGANKFLIGANLSSAQFMQGEITKAFVTGYAMSADEQASLYAVGSLALGPSPKNSGDHVEGMDASFLYATFDTLDSSHQIDLGVTL